MNENLGAGKYRAVLGDGNDKALAIVTIMDDGSISWFIVSEQEFNDADYSDLPKDLFGQINDVYEKLNFSDDDST